MQTNLGVTYLKKKYYLKKIIYVEQIISVNEIKESKQYRSFGGNVYRIGGYLLITIKGTHEYFGSHFEATNPTVYWTVLNI